MQNQFSQCPRCGTVNDSSEKFCRGCGNKMLHSNRQQNFSQQQFQQQPINRQVYYCPNCNNQVSFGDRNCLNCRMPLNWQPQQQQNNIQAQPYQQQYRQGSNNQPYQGYPQQHNLQKDTMFINENPVLEVHPSWWHYFWHFVFCTLIFPPIMALFQRKAFLLRIYPDRIVLEKGVLSKRITNILISDIRSLDIKQNFIQGILGIGNILIGTAATYGYEIVAAGFPDPRGIYKLIMTLRQNTTRYRD